MMMKGTVIEMNGENNGTKTYSFMRNYTLIQQSPLIHFQHTQDGATLRATEVKPKLDEFLKSREEIRDKRWFVKDTGALNYKLRFIEPQAPKKRTLKDYKFYFGNMGNDSKDIVFRNITLQIICTIKDLGDLIDKNIKEFFILNNFGTRQSKGFGGFIVKGTTCEEIDKVLEEHSGFRFLVKGATTDTDLFKHALAVYSVMKGGINAARFTPFYYDEFKPEYGRYLNRDAYVKGYIQRSYLSEGVSGDKAFMKRFVVRGRTPTAREKENFRFRFPDEPKQPISYTFVRAILGLADHIEFYDDIHCDVKEIRIKFNKSSAVYWKKTVHIMNFDDVTVTDDGKQVWTPIQVQNGKPVVPPQALRKGAGIKRFKTPITIKMFMVRGVSQVVFIFDDSFKDILGKTFFFLNDKQKKEYDGYIKSSNYAEASRLLGNVRFIKTPDSFDKDEFINGFVTYFEREKSKLGKCDFVDSQNITLTAFHKN